MREGVAAVVVTLLAALPCAAQTGGKVTRYTDPAQQTLLGFGDRSHWLQPWRAYEETPPTTRLREAVGINLNVSPDEAEAVCAHLERHRFTKVRIEWGWGNLPYDHPDQIGDMAKFDKIVGACRRHHLRPLILLNSHHAAPCPMRAVTVHLVRPAAVGDRVVYLDPRDVGGLVAGRSGLSNLTDYKAAQVLFTRLDPDGRATLSMPLPKALPVGAADAVVLRYRPFYPATRKGGGTYPEFAETLNGWLAYVRAVSTNARRVLGTDGKPDAGFDLEVWNEITFGSDFLNINNYYAKDAPVADGDFPGNEIVRRTVAFVRDGGNGLPNVSVCDGFNNQWPWGGGGNAAPGLTALGKHPYQGTRRWGPSTDPNGRSGRPLDALGRVMGTQTSDGTFRDAFVPTYVSNFPEYGLNALQTEHWIRDLSPITTDLYGVKHGRYSHPTYPDGKPAPAPDFWITEVNLDPGGADPGDLTNYLRDHAPPPGMTPLDGDHLKAKAVLRYLVSYTGRGRVRLYFFAAHDDKPLGLGLISPSFFAALKRGTTPDEATNTSRAMAATERLVRTMDGGGAAITRPRPLTVREISETHGHRQWDGDPKTVGQTPNPRPPLYNRECVAVFPFQAATDRWVVALYVMTRNLSHLYRPDAPASDPTRWDMPPETYRITLSGVQVTPGLTLSLVDPLTGVSIPLKRLPGTGNTLTFEVPLTDSPRLLTIEE